MKNEPKSQIHSPEVKEFHLGILKAIRRELKSKQTTGMKKYNQTIVQEYLTGHSVGGGARTARKHCEWLGIDPKGYTIHPVKQKI